MLELMKVFIDYPMYKQEENTKYILQSSEIYVAGSPEPSHSGIWVQSESGEKLPVLPFYIVPGEIGLETWGKAKVFIFESNTGKTIKFFSPEGIVRETSGILLEKLNLLLKSKSREKVLSPDQFTIECFKSKAKETSKLLLLSLEEEKKIIPGVYIHRNDMEIKLREWIGARSSILQQKAGSGKTNLLSEIYGQYLERGLTCLFIRASRLRTNNLREDLSEILDLDTNYQLKEYASIAGTQIKPVIILLDSLNESRESIKLWKDIKSISRDFEPGSLKWVVTCRANNRNGLSCYRVEQENQELLYRVGVKANREPSYMVHWLSPMNMEEIQQAWGKYVTKDPTRYKPEFTFNEVSSIDRNIYKDIGNPLILRLFLETYSRKGIPPSGQTHLRVWDDWLRSLKVEEQMFLEAFAEMLWEEGKNELDWDKALKSNKLMTFLTSDNIREPYHRLKNQGWITRYNRENEQLISFTSDGCLFWLIGCNLMKKELDENELIVLFNIKDRFRSDALEEMLLGLV